MKRLISLLLACLILAGCSNTPKPEPTPTATPEPTVEATPEIKVTEGYYIILQEEKELSFEQFIQDELSYNFATPTLLCEYFKDKHEDYYHFKNNNGEIKISDKFFGPNKNILPPLPDDISMMVGYTIDGCPSEIEKVKNYTE
ncbi:hypothetical protein [Anaerorhabdus sp.]|uniref:hypothetical protein n=1 Tax=Anaerorhabdus sp. TaxID=1872524 RepID=UPI002B20A0FF|nr:hypothetical protein [Anaerorhabdus sp.]MEA4873995.1 hypothetical protein [Anaerorhabdus sp.]